MARKDAILNMRDVLIKRRDALRKALAGDLSMLKELREQTKGDVIDFALDAAQDEISSQLAEVESRELTNIENALERMREGAYGMCQQCSENIPLAICLATMAHVWPVVRAIDVVWLSTSY